MKSLDEYLRDAEQAHGHLCAGQVLGVRLAMLGLQKLGIDDPRGKDRKRLVTFVEIDRCATDAVAVVTGCRLGKRALKFRDWGKVAATFVDVSTGKAIRIAAKESSKALARQMHPEIADKNQQQMLAYREITDDDLFTTQWVRVDLPPEEFPGYKGERVVCAACGEGINFRREVAPKKSRFAAPAPARVTIKQSRSPANLSRLLVRMCHAQNRGLVKVFPENLQPNRQAFSRVSPQGTEMPGIPARSAVTV
jgi:formylmethanofuran dehydrogenase subunit E